MPAAVFHKRHHPHHGAWQFSNSRARARTTTHAVTKNDSDAGNAVKPSAIVDESVRRTNQIGFTGRYEDKESKLLYFRARYYSGSLGRFVNRDKKAPDKGLKPKSRDGYKDGYSLYKAYYIPNKLDPKGLYTKKAINETFEEVPDVPIKELACGKVKFSRAFIDASETEVSELHETITAEVAEAFGEISTKALGDIRTPAYLGAGVKFEFIPNDPLYNSPTCCCKKVYWSPTKYDPTSYWWYLVSPLIDVFDPDWKPDGGPSIGTTGAGVSAPFVDFPGNKLGTILAMDSSWSGKFKTKLMCENDKGKTTELLEISWGYTAAFDWDRAGNTSTVTLNVDW